ncbi:MAG: hypothetical protein ABSA97_15460 [Verrucomicrobiia bacterium]
MAGPTAAGVAQRRGGYDGGSQPLYPQGVRALAQHALDRAGAGERAQSRHGGTPLGVVDLEAILCVQHERVVATDNTMVLGNRRLQIAPSAWRCSFARCTVRVCEQLDGTLTVRYGPHLLGRWNAAGEPLEEKKKLRKAA